MSLALRTIKEIGANGTPFNCMEVSSYCYDKPAKKSEIIGAITVIQREWKMTKFMADQMLRVMIQEGWSVRRVGDAVDHVLKTHIFATANVGIEPGVFLSYDKRVKLYTYGQMLNSNYPQRNYEPVLVVGNPNYDDKGKEVPWWILKHEQHPFALWWDKDI